MDRVDFGRIFLYYCVIHSYLLKNASINMMISSVTYSILKNNGYFQRRVPCERMLPSLMIKLPRSVVRKSSITLGFQQHSTVSLSKSPQQLRSAALWGFPVRSISCGPTNLRTLSSSSQSIGVDKAHHSNELPTGSVETQSSGQTATGSPFSANIVVPRTTRRSSFSTNGQNHFRHHRSTNTMMNQFVLQQFKPEAIVPVRAVHAAQTIDLGILQSAAFQHDAIKKQMFGKNSIVIQLSDNISIQALKSTTGSKNGSSKAAKPIATNHDIDIAAVDPNLSTSSRTSPLAPRYMAVFRFGSIVYFNVEEDIAKQLTCSIKKIAAFGPVPAGLERRENFGVLVTRDMDFTSNSAMISSLLVNDPEINHPDVHGNHNDNNNTSGNESLLLEPVTGDYCMVPELDMNGVAVIGTIMGQTVTLDSYSDTVEELLTNFARINSTVTQTGSFTSGDKSFLFKTVAQNNSIFIDMISKVRIKDRSDTAWNLTKYETIHYGLKEEFVRRS